MKPNLNPVKDTEVCYRKFNLKPLFSLFIRLFWLAHHRCEIVTISVLQRNDCFQKTLQQS